MTILYSPSNVLCSSDKSERVKQFKPYAFIGMCSLSFHLAQRAKTELLLMKTHLVE